MAQSSDDAGKCLQAARAGSREALGQALDGCRRYLLGIAEKELDADLRAKGGASDLVQETFIDAQKLFPRFEGDNEEQLLAWLRQLLLYNVAGFTRRFRAGKRDADREAVWGATDSSAAWEGQLPAQTGTPSAVVRGAEEAAHLEQALARLPDDYQQVLRCRYQEDLTFEQIGERMGRTANAARKLWVRAIQDLQRELKSAQGSDPSL
jgi:RNA polymerase sigma-70 factor (ECF subfamily)